MSEGFTPSDLQAGAIRAIKRWFRNGTTQQQVFRVFGYAGVGKTSITRHAIVIVIRHEAAPHAHSRAARVSHAHERTPLMPALDAVAGWLLAVSWQLLPLTAIVIILDFALRRAGPVVRSALWCSITCCHARSSSFRSSGPSRSQPSCTRYICSSPESRA